MGIDREIGVLPINEVKFLYVNGSHLVIEDQMLQTQRLFELRQGDRVRGMTFSGSSTAEFVVGLNVESPWPHVVVVEEDSKLFREDIEARHLEGWTLAQFIFSFNNDFLICLASNSEGRQGVILLYRKRATASLVIYQEELDIAEIRGIGLLYLSLCSFFLFNSRRLHFY